MSFTHLIQEEIRRGAQPNEIAELTAYLQSGKFNTTHFSNFLNTRPSASTPLSKGAANYSIPEFTSASSSKAEPKKRKRRSTEEVAADKKKKAEKDPEKRTAVFRKKPSKAILERADRVESQRMFLISRSGRDTATASSEKEERPVPSSSSVPGQADSASASTQAGETSAPPEALSESFQVLGSTGNVYTVTISRSPTCSCPDFQKGNLCKHLVFVYLRVLRLPRETEFWYQKALLTSEVNFIFDNAIEDPTTRVEDHVKKAWEKANGKGSDDDDGATESEEGKKRLPQDGDRCAICFENFDVIQANTLVYCLRSCGNALHPECERAYAASARAAPCVYCRAPSSSEDDSGVGVNSEGYLNLAAATGMSQTRDTNSYYHGPMAGQAYYGDQEARYGNVSSSRGRRGGDGGYGTGWGGY